jgi:hypothetical protein
MYDLFDPTVILRGFFRSTALDGLVLDEYWKNKEEVLSTLGWCLQAFF